MPIRVVLVIGPLVALSFTSPALAEDPGLSPGARVRITPSSRVEIPGVLTVEGKGGDQPTVTAQVAFERRGNLVVARSEDRTLAVPVPGKVLYGDYVGLTAGSILVRPKGAEDPVAIPHQAVARLEVRRRSGHAAMGAGIGAVLGFGIGYAVGSCDEWGCVAPLWGAVLAIPGAIAGAAVGGTGESWDVVSTDTLRIAIGAGRGAPGPALTVAVRF